jgi:CheY-like chemotaxis protein
MAPKYANLARPRILVVDSEPLLADTLTLILQGHGYDATAVYSGRAALDCCDAAQPQLLITEVTLPDLNGIDLASRIREKFPACKVLLYSGQVGEQWPAEPGSRTRQQFPHLTKPIAPAELLEKVAECLGISWPEQNE